MELRSNKFPILRHRTDIEIGPQDHDNYFSACELFNLQTMSERRLRILIIFAVKLYISFLYVVPLPLVD